MGLARALDECSDHQVEHEPEPRLLEEAARRHVGQPYRTALYERMIAFLRGSCRYGETFRAAPLLQDVTEDVTDLRVAVLVRHPLEYIASAHRMGVLARGDLWDQTRILPKRLGTNHAQNLAAHWSEVNRYLLTFAADEPSRVRVVVTNDLTARIDELADHLGVRVTAKRCLVRILGARLNSTRIESPPEGFAEAASTAEISQVWNRALSLSA